ncbi:uncharacterized protein LOC126655799 isoform X2 [Mercurialis annua]|uniref:uncharacterized protein LOC126655799 isoform X2 n=1 Tax=Mercurialis annua TaxID=3986 RepID=UPI00215E3F7D|nr:uncharacterized protein LOC126655799 isoform X2 [Mercurialis annua]
MACTRTIIRCSAFVTEPWVPFHFQNRALFTPQFKQNLSCGFCSRKKRSIRARNFHFSRLNRLNCSYNDGNNLNNYSSAPDEDEFEQEPPQEAVLKAISEVSKTEGRVGQTTNVVIGGTVTDDSTNEWLALDQKVNSYPTVRGFTAIGTGGDDFVQAMVVAVESVIQQPIPEVHDYHD